MKKKLLIIFLFTFISANVSMALTGREIIEINDKLPEADTAYSEVLMNIYKGNRVIKKEFKLEALKIEKNENKALISFIRPTKIKLLTHSHKVADDDQWLRLSSGRVKRITSSSKGKSFVNSHFYYEDLSSRNIDDYTYKLLGEKKVNNSDCYMVEAISKKKKRVYDKTILYPRKTDCFIMKIDFYRNGKFDKTLENFEIKKVDNILTPFKSVMIAKRNNGKTELLVKKVEYNTKMPSSKFRKEALR